MLENREIINSILKKMSLEFKDFKKLYFFGSRQKNQNSNDSDIDVLFVFDDINSEKKSKIAGIIGELEYKLDIFIDYKLFTSKGKYSIEFIRKNINPVFIKEAVDKGEVYSR